MSIPFVKILLPTKNFCQNATGGAFYMLPQRTVVVNGTSCAERMAKMGQTFSTVRSNKQIYFAQPVCEQGSSRTSTPTTLFHLKVDNKNL